jgi:molybdate transport system substrate-binding protein
VAGEPLPFTTNRLVIVTPPDNPAGIASLDDLAGDDINLVLANASVPAGNYARQAMCAYDASGEAPDGFAGAIAANIVSEEEDVRSVLAKVQLGEADAGIVYASDAVASEKAGTALHVIEFPPDVPVAAAYPIAALADGNVDFANAFIAVILSPEGQAVLADYGFGG